MKPALQQQACFGGRPPPLLAAPCRRPAPRRSRCSAEGPRAEERDEGEKPITSSPPSPPPPPRPPPPDPEKRWRRLWGGNPHGVYRVPGVSDWFARAPQVRVRSRTDRQLEQLADLAVVNERLAGGSGHQARARVDFLRGRRRLWARVYDVVTRSDVGATLDSIERATGEVRGALELTRGGGGARGDSEEGGSSSSSSQQQLTERERLGVAALRERLVSLQEQLAAATERISTSRAKLSYNEERLRSLKAAQEALEATLAREEAEEGRAAAATAAAAAAAAAAPSTSTPTAPLLPLLLLDLKGSWIPLAFVADLDRRPGIMLPVEVAGVPWVLFRTTAGLSGSAGGDSLSSPLSSPSSDADANDQDFRPPIPGDEEDRNDSPVACLRDQCAHRACPLSLGRVDAAGRAVCPYHGWAYSGLSGSCVEMPSTLHRRGVGVETMRVGVRDGVVWGWAREKEEEGEEESGRGGGGGGFLAPSHLNSLPLPPLPATAATPRGFVVVAEAVASSSSSPPEAIRDALLKGEASLVSKMPESAAARGLLPSSSSSSGSLVETSVVEQDEEDEGGKGASIAVVTLASGFGGSGSSSASAPSRPPLRLLHLVTPGRDGGSRLLLRVSVAEGAVAAVFGSGKRRLWGALTAEAVEEDAKLGSVVCGR